jgi:hypothetical protein
MIDKIAASVVEALANVRDGSTVLIGGFGTAGIPAELIDGLIEQGATDLTVVNNNAGNAEHGLARLLRSGRVRKIICSFPRQVDSYVFDEQINTVLRQLPDQRGPVQVEGFGQTFEAPMNDPLAYHRVNEVTAAPVSLAMETDDTKGLAYLGGPRPIGLEFRPDYRYVLTRLPDIRVPTRRVIARSGPVALQERTGNLDVTLNSGTFAPQAWQHDAGTAWVQSGVPVNFWVIGGVSRTVWLRVTLRASVPLKAAGASVTALRQGRTVFVCMPVQGPPPVRRADMYFTFEGHPPPSLKNEYALPYPTSGVKLVEMRVDYRPCR